MSVFDKIEAQQKGLEYTAVWMVGEQLKDICREDPHCAELVDQDLENKSMSLAACEKQLKAWADAHKKDSRAPSSCVPPTVADEIIRKFYGLPERSAVPQRPALTLTPKQPEPEELDVLDLLDLT